MTEVISHEKGFAQGFHEAFVLNTTAIYYCGEHVRASVCFCHQLIGQYTTSPLPIRTNDPKMHNVDFSSNISIVT